MTPSEKHLETAEKITNDFRMIVDGCEGDLMEIISRALAQAERDGMKRAAEIARRQAKFHLDASAMSLPVEPSPIIARDRAKIATVIADRILSEAGEE